MSCLKSSLNLSKLHNCLYTPLLCTGYILVLVPTSENKEQDLLVLHARQSIPAGWAHSLSSAKPSQNEVIPWIIHNQSVLMVSLQSSYHLSFWRTKVDPGKQLANYLKQLCPKDSRIFGLLVWTSSIFTDELAMACQKGKTGNLEFRYFICTLEFEEK